MNGKGNWFFGYQREISILVSYKWTIGLDNHDFKAIFEFPNSPAVSHLPTDFISFSPTRL